VAGSAATGAVGGPIAALIEKAEAEGPLPVIVELTSNAAQDAVIAEIDGLDAEVTVQYNLFPLLALRAGPDALAALAVSPRVVSVREDIPRPPALNTTLPVINGDDVQNLGWDGSGQTVAILDTGIDVDHDFFGAGGSRIVSQACYSNSGGAGSGVTLCPDGSNALETGNAADAETAQCLNGTDNICDHGSHVAGIAAGSTSTLTGDPGNGVAPGSTIIAIQVFTRFNSMTDCNPDPAPCVLTYEADQISALERVLELDTSTPGGTLTVAAANMSLGGGEESAFCNGDARETAVTALLNAGIAPVISAGNDSFDDAVGAPGCIQNAITVGSTNDDDTVSSFSNRGTLLDLFAPGCINDPVLGEIGMISSVPDDAFGRKCGTSMAAPMVTGAFAILREAYPTATIATLLQYMQDTGVDITYTSGGGSVTTPRLNLLAALQEGNNAPSLTVDNASVTVNEGQTATNSGTFSDPDGNPVTLSASVGTVTDTGGGNWSWSFTTSDGPSQNQTVTITATDDKGESGTVTFQLTVNNVNPTVAIAGGQVTIIAEGDTITVNATFSDPGWNDNPYTATVDWGTPAGDSSAGTVAMTNDGGPAPDTGTVTGSFQYGDDGVFTITVTVTDKDGGSGSASFNLTVGNIDPTAAIDETGTVLVNGTPTFVAQVNVPLDFHGNSTDPGSDDLTLSWDWDDGAPAPDVTMSYLVNPPGTDPDPSPSVQPRDETDTQTHAFTDACLYEIVFSALDDDGGSASDSAIVIIAGDASKARSQGYWQHQYKGNGKIDFTTAELNCYLEIVGYMSAVFNEARDASTIALAYDVLFPAGPKEPETRKFDRQLLTVWLNFANGAIALDDLFDSNNDGLPDTTVGAAIVTAEAVRLNPASTSAQIKAQEQILKRLDNVS
jgi:subtilisin family serine protease